MRFPEWLYRLLAGDEGTQQLGIVWREATASLANVNVGTAVYTVAADKCLVLTNATLRALPGAAQLSIRRRVMADPPTGSVRYNIVDDELNTSGGGQPGSTNWQGEVVIPGGWKVRVEGDFDAGANANEINGEIHGYLIPRGTFIFG